MKKYLYVGIILGIFRIVWAGNSITGNDADYLEVCQEAVSDEWYFENFRSLHDYTQVIEINCGSAFADFLKTKASKEVREKFSEFEKLDEIGSPLTRQCYEGLGNFSGATLRYIVIADHIKELFSLCENAKIVEIGAGFGGQCYILSRLQPFLDYYIIDLPEVEPLIKKVINTLQVKNVSYSSEEEKTLEEDIDLVISNYAFSECDRQTQEDYFEKIIKKSKRGYIIYNQIAYRVFGLDSLTPLEFVAMLQNNNMNPKIYNEPVATAKDNLLIVWDKTLN